MWLRNISGLLLLFGVVSCDPDWRIVNGTEVEINKYPYMVSLRYPSGYHHCGGTIINPRWILTAGHCVWFRDDFLVQYGTSDTNPSSPNRITVKNIIFPEDFDILEVERNFRHDIALLELSEELILNNETVAAVRLPSQDYEIPQRDESVKGVTVGWGYIYRGGPRPRKLLEAEVNIFSDEDCNRLNLGEPTVDSICGGLEEGHKGVCYGDSGGPLFEILPEGNLQLGVLSGSPFIHQCAYRPAVYTKVSHYINWINKHIY